MSSKRPTHGPSATDSNVGRSTDTPEASRPVGCARGRALPWIVRALVVAPNLRAKSPRLRRAGDRSELRVRGARFLYAVRFPETAQRIHASVESRSTAPPSAAPPPHAVRVRVRIAEGARRRAHRRSHRRHARVDRARSRRHRRTRSDARFGRGHRVAGLRGRARRRRDLARAGASRRLSDHQTLGGAPRSAPLLARSRRGRDPRPCRVRRRRSSREAA